MSIKFFKLNAKYLIEFIVTMIIIIIGLYFKGHWLIIGSAIGIFILIFSSYYYTAFNPAVVMVLFLSNKLSKMEAFGYIISEMLGAISAYYIFSNLKLLF